ncbi:hypothetical protein AAZX31_08G268800 [Glycine max]
MKVLSRDTASSWHPQVQHYGCFRNTCKASARLQGFRESKKETKQNHD